MSDVRKTYLLGLRALELASSRVREACEGDAIDAATIDAHFGLHAVYGLHENFFLPRGIREARKRDELYKGKGGEVVGALVFARGSRTHQLVTFATTGGFGDLPYGLGPYGSGWIWAEHGMDERKYVCRASWYQERVRSRLLYQPLDEAFEWFARQSPEELQLKPNDRNIVEKG